MNNIRAIQILHVTKQDNEELGHARDTPLGIRYVLDALYIKRLTAVSRDRLDDLVHSLDFIRLHPHPQASPQMPVRRRPQVLGHYGWKND